MILDAIIMGIKELTGLASSSLLDDQQKEEFEKKSSELQTQLISMQSQIATIEASGNTIQRSWRPLLMLVITTMLANSYLLAPYLGMHIDFPIQLWHLMDIAIGAGMASRGLEKIIPSFLERFTKK